MDRVELSEESIHEVGALFEAALREAAPELSMADLAGIERRLQAVGRQVLGPVVERVLALRAANQELERLPCAHCGGAMRRVDPARERHIRGVVGDYVLRRAYDLCDACRCGQAPLDVRLGLGPGALSPALERVVCRLGIEAPFEAAMEAAGEALGTTIPVETARRATEAIGAVAEAAQQADIQAARQGRPIAATAPITTGVLAVAVDGVQVPHRDGWHEVKVGVCAPLGPGLQIDAETRRAHLAWGAASYCAGGEEAEAFWWRVYAEACRRGLGTPAVQTVIVLGDGAEWIWQRAAHFLGARDVEVVEIADIYHAYAYLWAVGNAVFGAGSARATAWVEPLKDRLYERGTAPILFLLIYGGGGVRWKGKGADGCPQRAHTRIPETVTLHQRDFTQMPADTGTVGRKLLAESDPYRVIGDHLAELLDDAPFADLYDSTGRAALSPALLAMVTLFQYLETIPDREAARQVVVRLDWKYALHLPLDDAGFDFSCLSYFRRRLLAHGQERLVFEQILGKVQALGLIKKRGTQRTDSLAVLGAVRQLSALETVGETLRLAVRAVVQADADWVAREVPATFVAEYAARRGDYGLSAQERAAALHRVGDDGVWLLERLDATASVALRDLEAVAVLRAVWDQRYERGEDRVHLRVQTVDCTALIVTPHDPGVRAAEKRGKKWRGDKVHVTETAAPGGPNFLTDVTTAPAPSGDTAALPTIRQRLAERDLLPAEQVVDAGYVSGTQLAQSREAGIDLVGPALPDTSPLPLKIADFTIDRAAKRAICPQGHASVKWGESRAPDGSRSVHIEFAAAVCVACPLRPHCTTGKSGRSLRLSEHYELVAARRLEAQTEEFRERMRARPAIEATLSELVRKHGLRRHRYRGEAKRAFENLLKGAACNLKRLARALVARPEAPDTAPCAAPVLQAQPTRLLRVA